jgi:hypothetical protein
VILVLSHAESEESEKDHVRFRVGFNARSDDSRVTVHCRRQGEDEVPPQVGFRLGVLLLDPEA